MRKPNLREQMARDTITKAARVHFALCLGLNAADAMMRHAALINPVTHDVRTAYSASYNELATLRETIDIYLAAFKKQFPKSTFGLDNLVLYPHDGLVTTVLQQAGA